MRVISTTLTRCPTHIYYLWASGRHAGLWLDCQRWRCEKCGPTKLRELAAHIGEMTREKPKLYELELTTAKQIAAAKKAIKRIEYPSSRGGVPSARFRLLDDRLIIVSECPVTGHGWGSTEYDRLDLLVRMADYPAQAIRRRDLTSDWVPEAGMEVRRETVLFKKQFRSPKEVDEVLKAYGASLAQEYVPVEPSKLAQELNENLGSYNFVNEDGENV